MNPPLVLAVIDGFGYSENEQGNAIANAPSPNLDYLWSNYPHFLIKAAEEEVGLNFGELGNSEVGHMAIGAGRVIPQSLSRINISINDGSFFTNEAFMNSINYVNQHQSSLHLIGMISTPGVHAHLNHYLTLIKLANQHNISKLRLHLILDGRDSGPKDANLYLREINNLLKQVPHGQITTLHGRAYAMDRNNNWERIEATYQALMGQAEYTFPTVEKALEFFYNQNLDDENIPPCLIHTDNEQPTKLEENDSIIYTNYREDRARQLTKALILPNPPTAQSTPATPTPKSTTLSPDSSDPVDLSRQSDFSGITDTKQDISSLPHGSIANDTPTNTASISRPSSQDRDNETIEQSDNLKFFSEFQRPNHPQLHMTTMTQYEHGLPVDVAFPPPDVPNTLSDVLSANNISQIHIAESEKYAHVTYFFNGGREQEAANEKFLMIPSVKPEEFKAHPEMSAAGITDAIVQSIQQGWRVIIFNFANPDMIGHTGDYDATVKAVECVDQHFKTIWDTISQHQGYLLITADHGNAESMIEETTGKVNKKHTINPVPFIIAHPNLYQPTEKPFKVGSSTPVSGLLVDVAPTILNLLGISPPEDMTGSPLLTV